MSPVEFHEPDAVADPVYFSVAEAREIPGLSSLTLYPDEAIELARDIVEDALERACGVAFVLRDATMTTDGNGTCDLLVLPRPREVTACTVCETTLTPTELGDLVLYRDGRIYRECGWPAGRGNVEIAFNHGYEVIPPLVKRAALELAKRFLIDTPVDPRASSVTGEDGTTQILKPDGTFGHPLADMVVNTYGVAYGIG